MTDLTTLTLSMDCAVNLDVRFGARSIQMGAALPPCASSLWKEHFLSWEIVPGKENQAHTWQICCKNCGLTLALTVSGC
jgi:hypothetical protein